MERSETNLGGGSIFAFVGAGVASYVLIVGQLKIQLQKGILLFLLCERDKL